MRAGRVAVAVVGALLIAGCGTSTTPLNFKGKTRPAAAENVSVYIGSSELLVDPSHVSAGLVEFNVTNQSGRSERLTVSLPGGHSLAATPKIGSGGTGQLQVRLTDSRYGLNASATVSSPGAAAPTRTLVQFRALRVTKPTRAGNSALLQP